MNIICPIFPESSSEAHLLRTPCGGEPYVDHALRRLSSGEGVRLNVLTDHKELYGHIANAGFNTFLAGSDDGTVQNPGPFAHFRMPLLKKMLGAMQLDGNDELVLLDIRYPLVTFSVMNEAVGKYRRSKKAAVVSVSEPVDHPAQVETYFTHVWTDILSMIDTGFDINRFVQTAVSRYGLRYPASAFSGVCFSKPFFFDWDDYGIRPDVYNSLFYRVFDDGQHSWARPSSGTDCPERITCRTAGKHYLFENGRQARRLYPSAELKIGSGGDISGLSFSKDLDSCRCLLRVGEDGISTRFFLHEEYVGKRYLMRIESKMASNAKDSFDAILIDIDRHIGGMSSLEAFGTQFHETDIQLDPQLSGDHFMVTLLENVSGGTADMSQPIRLENAPWYTDPLTKKKYDPSTKRELTGRQLFPKVYRLDGALLVADVSHVFDLESEIDLKDAEWFVLRNSISKKIASKIDLLRFQSHISAF